MRTIITGASGQLGQALIQVLHNYNFDVIETPRLDVKEHTIVQQLTDYHPELIIHAAAMTNVDACAKDPDAAFSVNAFGTQNVAHACLRVNAEMVCISTNEVFDGRADHPYTEQARPNPINPYGSSKRAGEQMAAHYLKSGLFIVRTSWLYGPPGHKFPDKIMAAADKQGQLQVVDDEISNPTYTLDLAQAIVKLVKTHAHGTYHLANTGYCSRYEFAKEVLRLSGQEQTPILPIKLAEYRRASTVPPFTPLANINAAQLGIELRPWKEALADYIKHK